MLSPCAHGADASAHAFPKSRPRPYRFRYDKTASEAGCHARGRSPGAECARSLPLDGLPLWSFQNADGHSSSFPERPEKLRFRVRLEAFEDWLASPTGLLSRSSGRTPSQTTERPVANLPHPTWEDAANGRSCGPLSSN